MVRLLHNKLKYVPFPKKKKKLKVGVIPCVYIYSPRRSPFFLSRNIKQVAVVHVHAMILISQTSSSHCSRSIGFSSSPFYSTTARKTQILHLDNNGGQKRVLKSVIVAASPITEDAVVATKPLTKEHLVGHLASGCKPKEKWR